MRERFVGIDVGAETIAVIELIRHPGGLELGRRVQVEHHKDPGAALLEVLKDWDWAHLSGAAVTGRFGRQVDLPRVPLKEVQAAAFRFLHGDEPATVVSIGSHGFSVLELRDSGVDVLRENSRCSQGTGNFLRQLVDRFGLAIDEASALCEDVADPAPLSGRCPVILKTDMTHLANKGESRPRILAGLYDAVCENVQVLIKPRVSPPRVLLVGGVTRSRRIRTQFRTFLERHEMTLMPEGEVEGLFLEALGAGLAAVERPARVPALADLVLPPPEHTLERIPSLAASLPNVRRMPAPPAEDMVLTGVPLVVGLDIGSTGSKAVALTTEGRVVWESYGQTGGDPVGAAQRLMRDFSEGPAAAGRLVGFGATGSGREIVGSLLATVYGPERVHVINEIAAHAEGALRYDPTVDTIFEIGGQDAKYIRLSSGRVVDAAMNEACSAGTGSFIEEQGKRMRGVRDVVHLGQEGVAAESGVSLGQHCSVFMAEIIDEAVASGVEQRAIVAGIYDSIIQNYLNRVKGSRSVGQVIFCQGMPFASDALAAAVARQTGSQVIVPPNPGTVGALGIGLLAWKSLGANLGAALAPGATPVVGGAAAEALDPRRFLEARVVAKEAFVCKSTQGCGGAGNRCRIDRLRTLVDGKSQRFTWGGGCSLWDRGTGKKKLPDLTPDPFRQRDELIDALVKRLSKPRGGTKVALTDEFHLKALFPFFATFLHRLGFDLVVRRNAGQALLKRGIEEANVPFCAPMQLYHGLAGSLVEEGADLLFMPMLRSLPREKDESFSVSCPIVQAAPDLLRWDLCEGRQTRIISPVIDVGQGNLRSKEFMESCRKAAEGMGPVAGDWQEAWRAGVAAQDAFDTRCRALGEEALAFCGEHDLVPVVVLGRPYTIYNTVLNSNVPAILREQGALAIPVDCYPVDRTTPVFEDMYWGYGQRNLRAAWQVRQTTGHYSLWASNYSCGPDSFNLHFYAYLMEGKPFAVIETDGHSGDAGTKTRVEAFLHCVREDLASGAAGPPATGARVIEGDRVSLPQIRDRGEIVLVPRMGHGAESLTACLKAVGVRAETLPMPDTETVRMGRRHTSGKECVPVTLTTGSVLQRLERAQDGEKFVFFMPSAKGPCRFGVYNLLHKIIMERQGYADRVRIWSPVDRDYFQGVPKGLSALVFTAFSAMDVLQEALYDVRAVESRPGAAQAVYDRFTRILFRRLENAGHSDLSLPTALLEVGSGRLFGIAELLRRAAAKLAELKTSRAMPTVMMVGEIYVRCDPFANGFLIEALEARGIRVRFAPFGEWLEYTDHLNRTKKRAKTAFGSQLSSFVQRRIQERTYAVMAEKLRWPRRTTVPESLDAASSYLRDDLAGEAVLTIGGPVHEWREGLIDGVVNVGPLECMPSKIAEAQLFHVAEREGLASLTLPVNGDPIDPEVLDAFAFEVHSRYRRKAADAGARGRAGAA